MAVNQRTWFYTQLASAAVLLSAALFMFALSSGIAPCNKLFAQSTSCNVGDTEIFTGATEFQGVIEVGATPTAGDANDILRSSGASDPPEWIAPGIVKTANETVNNSNTLQPDDELVYPLEASSRYVAEAVLLVTSSTAADFRFQFDVPSGTTVDGIFNGCGPACGGDIFDENDNQNVNMSSGTVLYVDLSFTVQTDSTAGNMTLEWAQGTADMSDTILLAGSGWTITRLE